MDPLATKALALVKAAVGALLKPIRILRAERAAGEAPHKGKSLDDRVFDAVLTRIVGGDPADALLKRASIAVANQLFTPEHLRTLNAKNWLQELSVRDDFKRAASAILLSETAPAVVISRLQSKYEELASASSQESAPVVQSICAMLVEAVRARIQDPGVASMLEAGFRQSEHNFGVLNEKIDDLLSQGSQDTSSIATRTPLDDATVMYWREAFNSTSRGLLHWQATLNDGEYIERPELHHLLGITRSTQHRTIALIGSPGSGKSALLARLGQALLENKEVAVLAIKGDLLDANVATEVDLQRDLQLPELPSVMLRRLADRGAVTLLIDQLDALAGHLDAKTGRLSTLLNLVKAVSGVDGLHILVSSRTFEFTHDIRLSRVDAESVTLELPPWETVLSILTARGIMAGSWNSDAREVLRVPQQLNTYLQLRASGIDEPISNYTAMLDSLWNNRVVGMPGGSTAAEVASEIAELMADMETLWLAGARFDNRAREITLLRSTGILIKSAHGSIGFSHQTVFEHILARNFARNSNRLSSYTLSRADSLFVRPKLWSALAYLRNVEPLSYEAELTTIWSAVGLRKHLRFLLIEFMGSQPTPTDKEVLLLTGAAAEPELSPLVLKAVAGSTGWFPRFEDGIIPSAMLEEKTADLCIQLLVDAWPLHAERVEALLRAFWLPNSVHDRRVLLVLQEAPMWPPSLTGVAKVVASRCEISPQYIDHFLGVVGNTDVRVGIELLRSFLDNELSRRKAEALQLRDRAEKEEHAEDDIAWHLKHNPVRPIDSLLETNQSWNAVVELATRSAAFFLETLWPWYLLAFEEILNFSDRGDPYFGYPLAFTADFRFEDERGNGLSPGPLLEAIALAVERLAEGDPQEFLKWCDAQSEIELTPVQRLIARGLARSAEQTARAGLKFLLSSERRYFLGSVSQSMSTSLALIAACAPYWSPEEIELFATEARAYSPTRPPEKSSPDDVRWWHRFIRKTRLNLIRALPPETRSPTIQQEVDAGDRAFPQHSSLNEVTGGWIGSPMSQSQLAHASNEDVLSAFKAIPDGAGWDHPKHFVRGGNVQLARAFAEFSKSNPSRALEILESFQPDFAQRAAGYAVEALAESYDPDAVMALALSLQGRGFEDQEFIESIARAMDRLVGRDIPLSTPILAMLEEWVFRPQATLADKVGDIDSNSSTEEEPARENSFLLSGYGGIELVPGGDYPILSTIVRARLGREEVQVVIRLLRSYLDRSQDAKTWEHLTHHLTTIAELDKQDGATFIGDVLSLPQLDGTRGAALLMAFAHRSALKEVTRNLDRWRNSKRVMAQRGYGELVSLLALTNPEAHRALEWLDDLVEDPAQTEARAGATATAVQHLWPRTEHRAAATNLILRLLPKNEAAVWREIFGLFRISDKLEAEPHTIRLLQAISDHIGSAPPPEESYVVERLGTLLPHCSGIVARIASHLIQLWRDQLANIGSGIAIAGQEMIDLAITLHRTEGTKHEGLQMFEQLIEIDAYQARAVLDELDHRTRLGGKPLRPRLPRRVHRPRSAPLLDRSS